MQKEMIKGISSIKTSGYRLKVLKCLSEKELLTPSEISNILGIRLNHVSMTLTELKKKDLVECVNEEAKRGRLYKITKLGQDALSWLQRKR